MANISNFILLQLLWLACIFGAAANLIWPASIIMVVMMYLFLMTKFSHATNQNFVILAVVIGFVLDSILAYFKLINYNFDLGYSQVAPFWIMYLWVGFALTLNHSMSWILKKKLIGSVAIAIGAPLSYLSAHKLNAIEINNIPLTLFIISFLWLGAYHLFIMFHELTLKKAAI